MTISERFGLEVRDRFPLSFVFALIRYVTDLILMHALEALQNAENLDWNVFFIKNVQQQPHFMIELCTIELQDGIADRKIPFPPTTTSKREAGK